jgi:GNAT superfamily N-acetyltransferase
MTENQVTIKEVENNKELRAFVNFPFSLYKGSPNWVPALRSDDLNTFRSDRNPAFEFCKSRYWLAYKQGKIVGRVAGIINQRHIDKWGQKYVRFGWIDFIDDMDVSAALLKKVEDWALENELEAVHGPLGFTDMDREGMLVEGFDELGTLATFYNYAYYPQHMQAAGYDKDTDWVEYEIQMPEKPDEKISRLSKILLSKYDLRLLTFKKKKDLMPYAKAVFDLLDETYSHLYSVTPLSSKQVDAYIKQYFGFINPDFAPLVVDTDDNLIAFGITMPSLSHALRKGKGRLLPTGFVHLLSALTKNDKGDLYLVAVRHAYQGKGINAILINRLIEVFNEFGIHSVESNPELEDNLNVRTQWKNFDHRQHKRRRIFIKHFENA